MSNIGPSGSFASPTPFQANQYIFNGTIFVPSANANIGDGVSGITVPAEAAFGQTGTQLFSAMRIPNIPKSASASASGNTAVWTPAAGKKFRLMRYMIGVTANASLAAAAVNALQLNDGGVTVIQTIQVFFPAAAATTLAGALSTPWISLGNGYLSTTANNALNINLPTVLATGLVFVLACGTEE